MALRSGKKEVVGLVPAGGRGTRLGPLPCSKELFPVGFRPVDDREGPRPKVVSHYLLEMMRLADIRKAYIILRDGKWDIPAYYKDGSMLNMHIGYLMMDLPFGVPYTLDQAYPFVRDNLVALGFPDMVIRPDDVFVRLLGRQKESGADLVLGLFPAHQPKKTDMVELDNNGGVRSICIKPGKTDLTYAWETAVWTPVFSEFMHEYLSSHRGIAESKDPAADTGFTELHVGDVIHAAIKANMQVDSVLFRQGHCLDIGTPEDLLTAVYDVCNFQKGILEEL